MITLRVIRKFPRNFNLPSGHLGRIMRHTSTNKNILRHDIVMRNKKRFVGLETMSRQKGSPERDAAIAVFTDILCDLKEISSGYKQYETFAWLTNVLKYNLRNSERNVLLLTVLTYEKLVKKEHLTTDNVRLSHVLGWCTEMINTAALMFDDIIDNSSCRRGQPCWHTLDTVGLAGINDAVLVENAVFAVLRKNFRHLDCYRPLIELFNELPFIAICAESLDMECASKCVSSFNMETYNTIAVNKVTYDNFYLPFAVAAQMAGFTDEEALRQSKAIILEIGLFFQIQNDFLDCFGTLETAGKVGTDIQDNKYSWLAVACMERATGEQKQIMMECYGKNDPENVQRVKELYKALDLPGVYAAFKKASYNNTKARIKYTSNGVPHELLLTILNIIYRGHH